MSAVKSKIGLVVGRFQPFHLGHLYLLNQALKYADRVVIAIGSSNIIDLDNPIAFSDRKKMLQKVIDKEGLTSKVLKIVPSPDHPDDKKWLSLLIKQTGKFDIAIGNNDWVNGILKNAGFKIIEIPYLIRDKYQGKFVREQFAQGKKWKSSIPSYLHSEVKNKLRKLFSLD